MLTRNDLVDIVLKRLEAFTAVAATVRSGSGRPFLSEYDIKKRLADGAQELRVSKDAIVSPLALDDLVLRRIKIVRSP